jgi:RNA polymerase subunit RPABC4/transcription elongation factor Spt4
MTLPSLDTLVAYSTFCFAIVGALMAAVWLSLIIWTFRDMRARSRDPFAQILATLVVALLPVVGLLVYLILRPRETLGESYERALEEEALLQEIEEKPVCPGCSRTIDHNWLLCPHCHTRLRKACPDCNSLMELQWNLCPYCGNQHIDPYHVGPPVVLVDEIIGDDAPISETPVDEIIGDDVTISERPSNDEMTIVESSLSEDEE